MIRLGKSDAHNVDDGGDCRPRAAVNALIPRLYDLPTDAHRHHSAIKDREPNNLGAEPKPLLDVLSFL